MRPAPTETANAAAAPTGKGPQARPARPPKADAFKGALARAMDGAGPPATAAALNRPARTGYAVAAAQPQRTAPTANAPTPSAPAAARAAAATPAPASPLATAAANAAAARPSPASSTVRDAGQGARSVAAALALQAAPLARPRGGIITPAAAAGQPNVLMRDRIAIAERSADAPDGGYGVRNASSGALGRYQFVPVALRDIGWQDSHGRWTAEAARNGVTSEADFLNNPDAQETAMSAYLSRIEVLLERNGATTQMGNTVAGMDGTAVPLTRAGLVAAAHRRGAGSVARYLAHRITSPQAAAPSGHGASFAAVERRLRDFANLPYDSMRGSVQPAVATAPATTPAAAVTPRGRVPSV